MTASWKVVALMIAILAAVVVLSLARVLEPRWVEDTLCIMIGGLIPMTQREGRKNDAA